LPACTRKAISACGKCRARDAAPSPRSDGPISSGRTGNASLPHGAAPSCKSLIEEKHKARMLKKGRWRALRPEASPAHAGFRISTPASVLPQARWGQLAAEFLRAKDDSATLKVFVNTESRVENRPMRSMRRRWPRRRLRSRSYPSRGARDYVRPVDGCDNPRNGKRDVRIRPDRRPRRPPSGVLHFPMGRGENNMTIVTASKARSTIFGLI
jgi:Phage terminase large subunit (GpA)